MKIIPAEQFKKQFGEDVYNGFGGTTSKPKEPGFFQRIGQDYKEAAQNIVSDITRPSKSMSSGASPLEVGKQVGEAGLRTVGNVAKAALDPFMEAPGIKQATEYVGEKIGGTSLMQKYAGWAQKHPEAAKDINSILNIAGLFGGSAATKEGGKLGQAAEKAVTKGTKVINETADKALSTVEEGATKLLKEGRALAEPPAPSPVKALGQVLQGQTKDIAPGLRGIMALDTKGIQTYRGLYDASKKKIGDLAKQVDASLDDVTPIKLNDLKLTAESTSGQRVSTDYVSRGLTQLQELYKSIGDDVAAKNISETLNKAKKVGLTRKEVNDIARMYGEEFGDKAFGKTGEPLTSVNAQAFENTRKGLKSVARQGIGSDEARAADKTMSDLYRVQSLVKKNVEAVNKLQQKIQERGILEKIGYHASKFADVLTGGSLRGVVGGLLPRGVGYKVMNALDLEQSLSRNLEIIQNAINGGDKELLKLIQGIRSAANR